MKKHNIFKVVLITLLVFLVLSWIFPAAYYSGEYVEQGRVQMGLFDLFNYPLTAISYFGYIAVFILFVGGFYGVLYKIPAYRSFLNSIVNLFKGKEKIFLSIVVILMAVAVSICGMELSLILFIPFIISIIMLMGFDKIVAAMTVVGGMISGIIGCTYSSNISSVATNVLSLPVDYEIGVRFILLMVSVALVIFNLVMYIKKTSSNLVVNKIETPKETKKEEVKEEVKEEKVVVKETKPATKNTKTSTKKKSNTKSSTNSKKSNTTKKTTKSTKSKNANKAALIDEDVIVVKNVENNEYLIPSYVDSKHTVWPFIVGFILLFVLTVLAFISWGETFSVSLFDDVTKAVLEFELFGFPLFGKLLGSINSFGNWTVSELLFPMALVLIILCIIYKVKFNDMLDGFVIGVKKALAPMLMAVLLYTVLVIVTYHPFQLVIYKFFIGLTKGFNVGTTVVVAFLASLFNSDVLYTFQSVLPYYVSAVSNLENYSIVGIIFQSVYGLAMLFVPTSLILMGTLSYLKVSYLEWLKNIWKLLLELFIVLLIVFIILALI